MALKKLNRRRFVMTSAGAGLVAGSVVRPGSGLALQDATPESE